MKYIRPKTENEFIDLFKTIAKEEMYFMKDTYQEKNLIKISIMKLSV